MKTISPIHLKDSAYDLCFKVLIEKEGTDYAARSLETGIVVSRICRG